MNYNKIITLRLMLALVLILTACAAHKADPCPTTAPLSCPTEVLSCPDTQACPTASALVPKAENTMYASLESADVTITFDPGNKCSFEGVTWIVPSLLIYDIVVNDQAYQNYYVAIVTLDAGKTLADLQALPDSYVIQPPFVNIIQMDFENPASYSHHIVEITDGPIYFACFVGGPGSPIRIGEFGPVNVIK